MLFLLFLLTHFPLISVQEPIAAKPPSGCDFWDPNWLPFDNMVAALNGYDLPRGDPFSASLIDPGWKQQIFEPTKQDSFGRVVLQSGIDANEYLSCSGSITTSTIRTMNEYKERQKKAVMSGYNLQYGLQWDVGINIAGVSASTTIPPFLSRSTSESESHDDIKQFFSSERGTMVQMESTCLTHKISIDRYVIPDFKVGFIASVKHLYAVSNKSDDDKQAEFKKFINDYGTHYSTETIMGAKIQYTMRVSANERSGQTQSQVVSCSKKKGLRILFFQVEKDKSECSDTQRYDRDLRSDYVSRESVVSFGSKPSADLMDWSKQSFDSPVPIRMSFIPIPNLFTKENLLKISPDINAETLLRWFVPMYVDMCHVLGIASSCQEGKGCGLDDDCTWEQTCTNDDTFKGYRCTAPKVLLIGGDGVKYMAYTGSRCDAVSTYNGPGTSPCDTMDSYDVWSPSRSHQLITPILKTCRSRHVCGLISENTVLIVGGFRSKNKTEAFSIEENRLRNLSPTLQDRDDAAAAVWNKTMYVCGGAISYNQIMNTCELYHSNSWFTFPPMIKKRARFAMAALDGFLYAIGGFSQGEDGSETEITATAERHQIPTLEELEYEFDSGWRKAKNPYPPPPKPWVLIKSMPTQRMFHASAPLDGFIYICGGQAQLPDAECSFLSSCDRYSPRINSWRHVPDMPEGRKIFPMMAANEKLYVFGDWSSSAVQIYDPRVKRWTVTKPSLMLRSTGACAVVI